MTAAGVPHRAAPREADAKVLAPLNKGLEISDQDALLPGDHLYTADQFRKPGLAGGITRKVPR